MILESESVIFALNSTCNWFVARMSAAAREGWHDLITSIYSPDMDKNLSAFNLTSITLTDMFMATAQRKEDFIVRYNLIYHALQVKSSQINTFSFTISLDHMSRAITSVICAGGGEIAQSLESLSVKQAIQAQARLNPFVFH